MMHKQETIQKAFVHIERDGRVFLVQEKGDAWGLWSLPGGHVDLGETVEEAVVREAKEESGYTIKLDKKLGEVFVEGRNHKGHPDDRMKRIRIHVFYGRAVGKQGDIVEDFLDARWVPKDEVARMPLRGEWVTMGMCT